MAVRGDPPRKPSVLIHEIPTDLMRDLCEILDAGEMWAEIAPNMPEVTTIDIDGCRKYKEQGSPSLYLLRIWASKGYSILDLYNLFAITRMVRCMELIRSEIDPCFHYLEHYCAPSCSGGVSKPHSVSTRNVGLFSQASVSHKGVSSLTSATSPSHSTLSDSSRTNMFSGLQNTPAIQYSELLVATNNFSSDNIIGKGGYGVVYRGQWKAQPVAVKRIHANSDRGNLAEKERIRQSLQELNTLAKYRHDNILPIYAFSMDGPEPCLVYQLMANGSVEDRIQCRKGSQPLSWAQRVHIAVGSACALHYLHTVPRPPLIHGDVKTANILLDVHFEPKLGDFGLSREGQAELEVAEKGVLIASHIKGTLAYLPPEFISSKILSTKLDVYSFGVVLFELATVGWSLDPRLRPSTEFSPRVPSIMGDGEFEANNPDEYILVLRASRFRTVFGSIRFKCLSGAVAVNGATVSGSLVTSDWVHVCAPFGAGRPAVLWCDPNKKYEDKKCRLGWRLKEVTPRSALIVAQVDKIDGPKCVLLVNKSPPLPVLVNNSLFPGFLLPPVQHVPSPLTASNFSMISEGDLPPPLYNDTVNNLMKKAQHDIAQMSLKFRAICMIVGAKDTGKSYLCRRLVNALRAETASPVYLLDCDVGQTEFTPPGCISFWKIDQPILDLPFCHQRSFIPDGYFLGDISPELLEERYKTLFNRLWERLLQNTPENSIVVINTMGWIEGLGERLLHHIAGSVRPSFVFSMNNQLSSVFSRIHHGRTISVTWNRHHRDVFNGVTPLSAHHYREMALLGYLSAMMPPSRPSFGALTEYGPISLKWCKLTCAIPVESLTFSDRCIFSFLNGQFVALCNFDGLDAQKWNRRRLMDSSVMPWLIALDEKTPPLRVVGFGLVRGVCMATNRLFLLTPLTLEQMEEVDCLARGRRGADIPARVITKEPGDVPYVIHGENQGITSELFREFHNVTGTKQRLNRPFIPRR